MQVPPQPSGVWQTFPGHLGVQPHVFCMPPPPQVLGGGHVP
jgi:hypothetical protein